MARSPLFDRIHQSLAIARLCGDPRRSTADAMAQAAEQFEARRSSRRSFLRNVGTLAAAGAVTSVAGKSWGAPQSSSVNVAIVGAGLAGLAAADSLRGAGINATLYEASPDRVGGRQWSDRNLFPGQVLERGGELIDNPHKTMLGYAQRFGLTLELQWRTFGGEETFYFGGRHVPVEEIIDEYRVFVDAMRDDLRALSGEVTANGHTTLDRLYDQISLAEYFDGANGSGTVMGPAARAAIGNAYLAEYGLELDQQSCLNFLFFAKADRRSRFMPFGVFSDERYHIVEGNDAIARGLRDRLAPGSLKYGKHLVRVAKRASGSYELTFLSNGRSETRVHDAVVLAVPFSVLRQVELTDSLGLPTWKRLAIDQLGYGNNAKQMVGFAGRPWADTGSVGVSYSDLANHQNTWETNPSRATASQAILTDYASGNRGAALNPNAKGAETQAFLADLDRVWPGAAARALRDASGKYVSTIAHWPSNPLSCGSYTCYRPGQFTSIAGNEATPVGNLFFAGEHTNSFYEWQGFMEGACLSGLAAASAILARVKGGSL